MPFLFWDPTMILLIPAMILAIYAQFKVRSTFSKYSKVRSSLGMTGAQVANSLLRDSGVYNVNIEEVAGSLTDHYDPKKRVLRLSSEIYRSTSVAAIGVAAHEVGHAIQDAKGYVPMRWRHSIFPVANLGSSFAFPMFFIGFLFQMPFLLNLGILFFAGAVLFHLVTLPVEFNASSRAIAALKGNRYLQGAEVGDAKKVLNAAALTYIASATMALLQLLRMILMSRNRD